MTSPAPDQTGHQPIPSGLRWELGVTAVILGIVGLLLLFAVVDTRLGVPDSIGALIAGAATLYGAYGIQHGARRTRRRAAVVALVAMVAAGLFSIGHRYWTGATYFFVLAGVVSAQLWRLRGNTPRGA